MEFDLSEKLKGKPDGDMPSDSPSFYAYKKIKSLL